MCSVGICTLGCKVNQYESQFLCESAEKLGFILKNFDEVCDIYIINSCTVTEQSDKKSRQMVRKARKTNKNAVVVLCGCFSQVQGDNLKFLEEADFIIGNKNKISALEKAIELFEQRQNNFDTSVEIDSKDILLDTFYEEIKINHSERARAYIKIQDGCNSKCSYCIIPKARGKSRSRKQEDVLDEILRFDKNGFSEIVLTGIEISSYGEDFVEKAVKLIDLQDKIDKISFVNIKNIRLGSVDPFILNKNFVDAYKNFKYFTPHFHLSVQSASDEILKKMRRKYNKKILYENIDYARKNIENLVLTADIIVGFPSENDENFAETLEFIREKKIYHTHIFPFSPRTGTEAASLPCPVDSIIKSERVKKAEAAASESKVNVMKENVHKKFDVILEDWDGNGFINAKTRNYIDMKIQADINLRYTHGEIRQVYSYRHDNLYLYAKLL